MLIWIDSGDFEFGAAHDNSGTKQQPMITSSDFNWFRKCWGRSFGRRRLANEKWKMRCFVTSPASISSSISRMRFGQSRPRAYKDPRQHPSTLHCHRRLCLWWQLVPPPPDLIFTVIVIIIIHNERIGQRIAGPLALSDDRWPVEVERFSGTHSTAGWLTLFLWLSWLRWAAKVPWAFKTAVSSLAGIAVLK